MSDEDEAGDDSDWSTDTDDQTESVEEAAEIRARHCGGEKPGKYLSVSAQY